MPSRADRLRHESPTSAAGFAPVAFQNCNRCRIPTLQPSRPRPLQCDIGGSFFASVKGQCPTEVIDRTNSEESQLDLGPIPARGKIVTDNVRLATFNPRV